MAITNFDQLDLDKTYSYFDYLSWKFKERVELFKGKVLKMSPATTSNHQRLITRIGTPLVVYLENQPCEVFYAPFDVRLEKSTDFRNSFTVVQPDISVICDPSKIDEKGCNGAPNLVVEILSPGNSKKEMKNKFDLYLEAGVEEYWIVDPEKESVLVYSLENGSYINHRPLISGDILTSKVIKDFELDLSKIFII